MIIDLPSEAERKGQTPHDSVPQAAQGLHDFGSQPYLSLNPGAPQRKPRSIIKFCLGIVFGIVCILGASGFFSNLWNGEKDPHQDMYHDTPEGEVSDWTEVVRPMITKDTAFDVVASVWVRDELAKDGVIFVDGEERSERLVYSGTVFKGVNLKSKNAFANVTLRVPTSHFKKANISNYDLRASFVLTQPNRPSWLDFAKNYTTWKPRGFKTPSVRKRSSKPTLEDEIYDSFGITIPLVQFHNIASRRSAHLNPGESTPQSDEEEPEWSSDTSKDTEASPSEGRNTFDLEFTGDQTPVTDYHPYITTRTHLRIVDETKLFKRQPYNQAQEELVDKICVDPEYGGPYKHPQWYQCTRSYQENSVFETKIHLQVPPSNSESTKEAGEQGKLEWLYAPFVSAMVRASGPKDLVAIPVDKEEVIKDVVPQALTPGVAAPERRIDKEPTFLSDDEYVTVTWKLSFAGCTPKKIAEMDAAIDSLPGVYNMAASQSELEYLQYSHDLIVAVAGHRTDGDAHPHRVRFLLMTIGYIRLFTWFLTVHYWYVRTSTVGIARLGTTFLALSKLISTLEVMHAYVTSSVDAGHWLTPTPLIYTFQLILPLLMLKAVLRLEFGRSNERGKGNRTTRIYLAKATHLERASERVEGRISRGVKLLLLVAIFSAEHFLNPSSMYLLTPRIQLPEEELSPVYSSRFLTLLQCVSNLEVSLNLTGSILQIIMNSHSKTYAGRYKLATMLLLFTEVLPLLTLMPSIVGKNTRYHGVPVSEAVVILVSVVNMVQAVRYRSAESLEDDVE